MADYTDAKRIMEKSFIGPEELTKIKKLNFLVSEEIPTIPYSFSVLEQKKNDYMLIFGTSMFENGKPVTIRNIKKIVGMNPEEYEPCFYNQDWYEHEAFIDVPMKDGWFLIRKRVFEESRAVDPNVLIKEHSFPNAIECCFAFFVAWLNDGTKLWYHDFVWCNDTDHNGDRIYVGKYHDVDGVNKNGFSVHRHLALRQCYGCVD